MNKKIITLLLMLSIVLIGRSEAITLTQKLGDSAIETTVEQGEEITLKFNNQTNYTFKSWTVESENVTVSKSSKTVTFVMPNEDVVIRANYNEESSAEVKAQYTVTYDANGGTVSPKSKTVTYGETYGTLAIPTWEGHTFNGWYTAASGGAKVTASARVTTAKDHTIYAHWINNNAYTLTYDANGGSGAPSAQKVTTTSSAYEFTISSTVPTKEGYKFMGWSKNKNMTSVDYSAGGKITISTSTTLYAVWGHEYILSYDANGGSGAPSAQKVTTTQSSYMFTISSIIPTKDGYVFGGWSKDKNATSASYSAGGKITISASTTLHAVWAKQNSTTYEYVLSYDANGGSGAPSAQKVTTTQSSYTFTISSKEPTYSGYTFKGWSKYEDATSASYSAGGEITISTNTTLYAVWQQNSTTYEYVLTYDANGGSGAPSEEKVVPTLSAYTFTVSNKEPTRAGYTFKGWSKDKNATNASYSAGDKITISTSTTLYAVWDTKFTLTYNANGGWIAPSAQKATTAQSSYTFTISTLKLTKDGYVFGGWSKDKNATSASYSAGGSITVSADTTLYAVWKNKVNVTYNANGGSFSVDSSETEVIVHISGEKYIFPSDLVYPTGYTFDGWYTQKTGGTKIESTTKVTNANEHTIYAHWKAKDVRVRYNPRGGTISTTCKYVKYGGKYGTLETATREGYTFDGWYTSKEDGTEVTKDTTVTNAGAHIIYAHWTAKEVNVTYDANGGGKIDSTLDDWTEKQKYGEEYGLSSYALDGIGYTFVGWYTEKDGGEEVTTIDRTDDHTVYAHWTAIPTYTVTYDANDGSGAPRSQTVIAGNKAKINSKKPVKTGVTFMGWSTSSSATSADYVGGDKIAFSEDTTLYAVYGYTLTYDANGGSGEPEQQIGKKITVSSVKPERDGYEFIGWSKNSSATGTGYTYTSGSTVSLSADTTIYAVWRTTYTLTFAANGGTGAPSSITVYNYNNTVEIPSGTPSRANYKFVGWGYDAAGEYSFSSPGGYKDKLVAGDTLTIFGDQTIYAQWEEDNITIILTYDANGGTNAPESKKFIIPKGSYVTVEIDSQVPKNKESNYFFGWGCNGKIYNAGDKIKLTESTTLWANWGYKYYIL